MRDESGPLGNSASAVQPGMEARDDVTVFHRIRCQRRCPRLAFEPRLELNVTVHPLRSSRNSDAVEEVAQDIWKELKELKTSKNRTI